mgnify:CR=1 FL=1|tara:strand:- start:527 stop:790 length:264 start_codon:yes stop_codon:yes gene_type:complete
MAQIKKPRFEVYAGYPGCDTDTAYVGGGEWKSGRCGWDSDRWYGLCVRGEPYGGIVAYHGLLFMSEASAKVVADSLSEDYRKNYAGW